MIRREHAVLTREYLTHLPVIEHGEQHELRSLGDLLAGPHEGGHAGVLVESLPIEVERHELEAGRGRTADDTTADTTQPDHASRARTHSLTAPLISTEA
jgi:hypothetical protein